MPPIKRILVSALALLMAAPIATGLAENTVGTPDPAPAAAAAPPRFVFAFPGRGFGHGLGMSQYGAWGAAKAGMTGEQIIGMYFPGTTLQTLPTTTVRVLLAGPAASVRVAATGRWVGTPEGGGASTPLPAEELVARSSGGVTTLATRAGRVLVRASGAVMVGPAEPTSLIRLNGGRYRGMMRLAPSVSSRTRVNAVNVVDLEQYLAGVLPAEMPSDWDIEALRAQAIAARSFAMATKARSTQFDMYADERSQVYRGVAIERPRANAAVRTTTGLVAVFQGKVATTFFSSTSGGRTENIENVFLGARPVPYLVSVDDARFDRLSPRHVWSPRETPRYTDAQLGRLLGAGRPVLTMRIVKRGVSGRVVTARVVFRDGTSATYSGPTLRARLGLRSTWFEVRRAVRR